MPEEIVITIRGPIGSGKSVLAHALKKALVECQAKAVAIEDSDSTAEHFDKIDFEWLKQFTKWSDQDFRIKVVSDNYLP